MPIHLRPLSRRNFLQRSLLAGGALTVAPELLAAKRRTDADSWVFFSDTHISADAEKIARNINMSEHLQTASKEVLELSQRPAGLFVVGDCAFNQGEPEDYKQFTKLIEPLRADGFPLHLTLGNHDQREHFRAALSTDKSSQRPVADKQVALVKSSDVNWFILDSLETTLKTPGSLGEAQLEWLAKTLDANDRKPAVVLIHHNPGTRDGVAGLKDTEALFAIIRPRTQVKAWVFGHTHVWHVKEDSSGIHLVNLPPVAYLFHPTDPAGWVHANIRKDGMKLELRCLDRSHKDHGQIVDLKWRV
jgi:Icc protein